MVVRLCRDRGQIWGNRKENNSKLPQIPKISLTGNVAFAARSWDHRTKQRLETKHEQRVKNKGNQNTSDTVKLSNLVSSHAINESTRVIASTVSNSAVGACLRNIRL